MFVLRRSAQVPTSPGAARSTIRPPATPMSTYHHGPQPAGHHEARGRNGASSGRATSAITAPATRAARTGRDDSPTNRPHVDAGPMQHPRGQRNGHDDARRRRARRPHHARRRRARPNERAGTRATSQARFKPDRHPRVAQPRLDVEDERGEHACHHDERQEAQGIAGRHPRDAVQDVDQGGRSADHHGRDRRDAPRS